MSATRVLPQPEPLPPARRAVCFGDRLGLALPGHLAAARRFPFTPVFVTRSLRELDRLGPTPEAALAAAQAELARAGFRGTWGAELTHLRTAADLERAAAAGYTQFSVDPSALIENRADRFSEAELDEAVARAVREGLLDASWSDRFPVTSLALREGVSLSFPRTALRRAAVKFAAAVAHVQSLARILHRRVSPDAAVLEVDLRGAAAPTSPLEHAFVAAEFQHRRVPLAALAPGWPEGFEPATDFRGDPAQFESALRAHAAIAARFGPYALSVPEASEKRTLLPLLGRVCGERLRIKTCGLSYLEGLRLVCRHAPETFREIAHFARTRFADARGSTRIATTVNDLDRLFPSARRASLEHAFFETPAGRQLLHATHGAVLGEGVTARGRAFREVIHEIVAGEAAVYQANLDAVLTAHLALLNRG